MGEIPKQLRISISLTLVRHCAPNQHKNTPWQITVQAHTLLDPGLGPQSRQKFCQMDILANKAQRPLLKTLQGGTACPRGLSQGPGVLQQTRDGFIGLSITQHQQKNEVHFLFAS